MTTTTTLARDYLTDSALLGFLKWWEENGEPILEFADWLMDRDLWLQGDCVGWALAEPLRIQVHNSRLQPATSSRPFPFQTEDGLWVWDFFNGHPRTASCLPRDFMKFTDKFADRVNTGYSKFPCFSTLNLALCGLLDGYAVWKGGTEKV